MRGWLYQHDLAFHQERPCRWVVRRCSTCMPSPSVERLWVLTLPFEGYMYKFLQSLRNCAATKEYCTLTVSAQTWTVPQAVHASNYIYLQLLGPLLFPIAEDTEARPWWGSTLNPTDSGTKKTKNVEIRDLRFSDKHAGDPETSFPYKIRRRSSTRDKPQPTNAGQIPGNQYWKCGPQCRQDPFSTVLNRVGW